MKTALGMLLAAITLPWLGLLLTFVLIMSLLGKLIGENDIALTIYIVIAMSAGYVLPVVASLLEKNFWLLIAIPILASVVFAVPSSFVAEYGCGAGKERAMYAMKAIPLVMAGYLVFAKDGEKFDCRWTETP